LLEIQHKKKMKSPLKNFDNLLKSEVEIKSEQEVPSEVYEEVSLILVFRFDLDYLLVVVVVVVNEEDDRESENYSTLILNLHHSHHHQH
jgi:hypothetical protein